MGHRLLFTCALVALGLYSGSHASASDVADYRVMAAQEALVKVGIRYKFGGDSPESGFDCSGLVAYVFQRAWGINTPRGTEALKSAGRAVKRAELQPGDLVFYDTRNRPFSHVGIYLGDGQFVHAPRPGARVRVERIDIPYWRARFNGARRLDPPSH